MSKATKAAATASRTFFQKTEDWLQKNDGRFFYGLIILCLFLSFISFNARISEAHDDALYLEGGWRFVNEFPDYFYTQNAPLYPLFLAALIKLTGFKLIIFKLFSTLFTVAGFILFYKAVRHRVPAAVFIPVAIFHAAQYLIIYYASMTFTEAFYLFLQGLFFFTALKLIDRVESAGVNLKKQAGMWLMLGLSMFLVSTAKSAAIVVVPAVLLFFVIERNWKAAGLSLAAYGVFKTAFDLVVRAVWGKQNQFKGQSRILLQKDPYDASLGEEDLSGFITRLIENTDLSLSKRFYQLIGWKDELNIETNGFVTLLTLGIMLAGFWLVVRHRNKGMLLLSLFTGAQLALSYLILQTRWDQPRITLVCMPVMLLLAFYALYHYSMRFKVTGAYTVIIALVAGSVLISSFKRGFDNLPVVQRNLKGDKYYGYTPDWQNFLKASEWCADSLPEEALVASRKAPMSFVYGNGKKFFPVYSVVYKDSLTNQSNPDSALAYFRKNNVTHVLVGSLRVNPYAAGQGIINTVHNIMAPIARKYPEALKLVHTEGMMEQTEVYELQYPSH